MLVYNLSRFLLASNNIHPSFPQELISEQRYSASDIISALKFLSRSNATSYNKKLFTDVFSDEDSHKINGNWNAKAWCKGEDILIIGSGTSLIKYGKEIENFITTTKIKALSLNVHKEINNNCIYAYVAADITRLILDVKRYGDCSQPIFFLTRFINFRSDFIRFCIYFDTHLRCRNRDLFTLWAQCSPRTRPD